MEIFARQLEYPTIEVPVANCDNIQHGQNENSKVENLSDAIDICARLIGT